MPRPRTLTGRRERQRRRHRHLQTKNSRDPSRKEQRVISCCAFGCTEQFKIGSDINFFKFPTNEIRRNLWTRAVKRMNWSPSVTSVLCGKHFQTGKPSTNPIHPDYVPNIFVMDSAAKHQSHSSTVPVEESQFIIQDIIKIEDMHFDPPSSPSFTNTSEGSPSKGSACPVVVPNSPAFTNSVEKHREHSSTAQREQSQCIIYDQIEIEGVPIDPYSSIDISKALTAGVNHKVLRIGTELEQQITEEVTFKKEDDEPLLLDAAEIVSSSNSRPQKDETSISKLKHNQGHTNAYTLRREKVDILKRLNIWNISSVHKDIIENYVTEKEEEISKLKKELQEAHKEISSLRSEKVAWQNYITDRITDRIFQDAIKLRFFTGLNSARDFQLLTKLLHDVETTATNVSVSSQLLIVLMRLQLNLKDIDLADRFQTSADTVKRICESVIPHLESKLKSYLQVLSPISIGMRPNISYSYTTTAFVKLYKTIQKYTKPIINQR